MKLPALSEAKSCVHMLPYSPCLSVSQHKFETHGLSLAGGKVNETILQITLLVTLPIITLVCVILVLADLSQRTK